MRKSKIQNLKAAMMSSLFLFVFFFSFLFPSLHFVIDYEVHHEHELSCSDHLNVSDCHLFIVHHEVENRCSHPQHIEGEKEICDLCAQLTMTNTYFHELVFNEQKVIDCDKKPSTHSNSTDFSFYIFTPEGRGPPVLL